MRSRRRIQFTAGRCGVACRSGTDWMFAIVPYAQTRRGHWLSRRNCTASNDHPMRGLRTARIGPFAITDQRS
jgi:hypothetical protein